jgi:NifU-like protein involved in Fe-S cluster formation
MMRSQGRGEPDEDVLEDAVAFVGVSRYPARIKCALLPWMAWKDATAQALHENPAETLAGKRDGLADEEPDEKLDEKGVRS